MNLIITIKVLIGTFTINIGQSFIVTSFQMEGELQPKIKQVIDVNRQKMIQFSDKRIHSILSFEEFYSKKYPVQMLENEILDEYEVFANVKCQRHVSKFVITGYLNGRGKKVLVINRFIGVNSAINSKVPNNIIPMLPKIGSKTLGNGEVLFAEYETDDLFIENTLFHKIENIEEINGFSILEQDAIDDLYSNID